MKKLRSINYRLRNRLKDLNDKVEKAINKTQTKRILAARNKTTFDLAHKNRVKDKELENAQKQLNSYTTEIESLRAKTEATSQVGKMLDSEQEIRDNMQIISDLKKAVKDKELILTNLAKNENPSYKISNMINEIRMYKEKIQKREDLYEKNENTQQSQDDNLAKLDEENSRLMTKIQSIDPNIDIEPNKSKDLSKKNEMEKVNQEIKAKKELFEETQRENNKELKLAQK